MKCIILAAGYATRLYPLTENFPKPLLKVGGRSIADHLVDDIARCPAVDEFVVITNHKFAGHFTKWASTRSEKITVLDDGTSTNETRLGAVRDIQFAIDALEIDDDCLVVAGDNVLGFRLTAFIDYARQKGTSCVMRYHEPSEQRLHKCGVLEIGEDDLVLGMEEKPAVPRSHWCCPPFYYYTAQDMRRIDDAIASGCGTDAPGSLVAYICNVAPVHAFLMPGPRYDVGSLESYREICKMFES
jgi:glucose-1-phosphate thymidylyltransferase